MSIDVKYRTSAITTGGRDGRVRSEDGHLQAQLSTPKELGGAGGEGTNPEQLFAAGYSACFLSALKFAGHQMKVQLPQDVSVKATVGVGPRKDGGYGLAADLTIDVPGAVTTSVDCINVKGTVAGSYDIGDGNRHGFVREPDGTITTFDGQDCDISPTSINRKGLVTGWCIDHQKPSHILGFVRKPDGTINEFHVPNGGSNTMPYGINDAGVIAGSYHSGGFLRFP